MYVSFYHLNKTTMKNTPFAFVTAVLFCLFVFSGISSSSPKTNFGTNCFDGKDNNMNYEYEVKTNIPPDEFTEHFYERLTNEYHWEKASSVKENGSYNSLWQFTDKHDKKWKCNVSISSVANKGSNIMSVSMKISPLYI